MSAGFQGVLGNGRLCSLEARETHPPARRQQHGHGCQHEHCRLAKHRLFRLGAVEYARSARRHQWRLMESAESQSTDRPMQPHATDILSINWTVNPTPRPLTIQSINKVV
jgi:hypothetical protein